MLPYFKKGDVLAAADLQALVARLRRLERQARHAQLGPRRSHFARLRAFIPAWQLAVVRGVLCHAQGFVEAAPGRLLAVGERGWNSLGACADGAWDVWLDLEAGGGEVGSARAYAAPRQPEDAGSLLHVRLGYFEALGRDEAVAVQLAAGLVSPFVPVMARGSCWLPESPYVAGGDPALYGWHDCNAAPHTAGAAAGSGYAFGSRRQRNDFELGWRGDLRLGGLDDECGSGVRAFGFCSPFFAL